MPEAPRALPAGHGRPSRQHRAPSTEHGKRLSLAPRLDALYHDYNREESASDPVHLVRPYSDVPDREIAGFCAAALAFGRWLFHRLDPHFEDFL